jgi:hypothetical protein
MASRFGPADRLRVVGLALAAPLTIAATWGYWARSQSTALSEAIPSASRQKSDAGPLRAPEAALPQRARPAAPLPSTVVLGKPSTQSITQIADTSEDPHVIAAALREVLTTYSSRSSQKPLPDAELERVLLKHVRSRDSLVYGAALSASRMPLMMANPSQELARAIADEAAPGSPTERRQAALEALMLLRPDWRGAPVLAAFEQALSAREPWLLSLALLALSQSAPSLTALPDADRLRIARSVLELGAHTDPGVRGRSLLVLAEVEGLVSPAERFSAGELHLADPHGYVRAQAADLLARCREPMGIHALVPLVGDLSAARYVLAGFSLIDGSAGELLHEVPGRARVAEAALLALLSLSQGLAGVSPLVLTLTGSAQSEALVLQNADIARAWYRSEADHVPRGSARAAQ